jgi:uncharacterized lipoprotein YmbA
MSSKQFHPTSAALLAILYVITGCALMGGGTRHATNNYILHSFYSENTQPPPVAEMSDTGILVGPIRMPLYLDRIDIVIRDSQSRIQLTDFAQWAGPLQENFSRVLAENLSVLLATDKIGMFPGTRAMLFDYNVTVTVTRFDGMPGKKVTLRARWSILNKTRKKMIFEKHSILGEPTKDNSMEALIAAESRALATLSREIAEAIKTLAENNDQAQ